MKLEQKQQITEGVNSWIAQTEGRSAAALAKGSNVSEAHISRIRKGEYEMNVGGGSMSPIGDAVFFKLASAIGLSFDNALHWDTPNFVKIQKVCKTAQAKHERVLLDADTGLGKTYALEHYAKQNDKVVYIKVTKSMSARDIVGEIYEKLRIKHDFKAMRLRMRAIKDKVTSTKGWLIIIDESEYLRHHLFHIPKEIADFTEGECGMILCGMDICQKISDKALRNHAGFKQLKRRFWPNRVSLDKIMPQGVRDICQQAGITEPSAINVLINECHDYDMLNQYIKVILEVQEKTGRVMTGKDIILTFDLEY